MADIRFNAAGHLEAVSQSQDCKPRAAKVGEHRAADRTVDHRWIDYPLLAVLACVTMAFWVGVAYLLEMAWKH